MKTRIIKIIVTDEDGTLLDSTTETIDSKFNGIAWRPGTSLADRGSQAAYELRQAAERIDELLAPDAKLPDGLTLDDGRKSEAEQLRDDLSNAADEAENVNYPGMYS